MWCGTSFYELLNLTNLYPFRKNQLRCFCTQSRIYGSERILRYFWFGFGFVKRWYNNIFLQIVLRIQTHAKFVVVVETDDIGILEVCGTDLISSAMRRLSEERQAVPPPPLLKDPRKYFYLFHIC